MLRVLIGWAIVVVTVVVTSGVAVGLASHFQHWAAYVAFGASAALALCYLCFMSRRTCVLAGLSGGIGGAAAHFTALEIGGFLGGVAAVLAGAAGSSIAVFVLLNLFKGKPGRESWRDIQIFIGYPPYKRGKSRFGLVFMLVLTSLYLYLIFV